MIAYLALTGAILVVGAAGGPTIAVHGAQLILVVAATVWRRAPAWARDWMPLIAIPAVYAELPAVIASAGHTSTFDAIVMRWELAVFGSQTSHSWAAAWHTPWLSEPLHAAYFSYYAIIVIVPALLYTRRRADFHEALFVLLLSFATSYLFFVAFPVEGPRYTGAGSAPDGPVRRFTLFMLERGASRGTAFPSSHVAVTVTQCVLAVRYFGARGGLLLPLATALALGAVYGGFHYGIDVVGGAAYGVLVGAVGIRVSTWATRNAPRQANATAPV